MTESKIAFVELKEMPIGCAVIEIRTREPLNLYGYILDKLEKDVATKLVTNLNWLHENREQIGFPLTIDAVTEANLDVAAGLVAMFTASESTNAALKAIPETKE